MACLEKNVRHAVRHNVDELLVRASLSASVCQGRCAAHKVHVVPNGVADIFFQAAIAPYPLNTRKRFKFLFVGGSL